MTTSLPPYVTAEYLASLDLVGGQGSGAPGSRCAMQEVRAWLDLDARSDDAPECVSPVIRAYVIGLNDASPATRAAIRPLLPSILGTAGSLELERRRSLRALDWLIREYLPAFLDLMPALASHAAAVRALPTVSDDNAAAAGVVVRAAGAAASAAARDTARDAAWAAAWTAARAAAWTAAGAAAEAAAGDVAEAAAWTAARAAAWTAAWAAAEAAAGAAAEAAAGDVAEAAAGDAAGAAGGAGAAALAAAGAAAGDALASTVATLQASAISLLSELCAMRDTE